MFLHVPVLSILLAVIGAFLAVYLHRRRRALPPLSPFIVIPAQGLLVAALCLAVFHEDVQRYVDWLIRP